MALDMATLAAATAFVKSVLIAHFTRPAFPGLRPGHKHYCADAGCLARLPSRAARTSPLPGCLPRRRRLSQVRARTFGGPSTSSLEKSLTSYSRSEKIAPLSRLKAQVHLPFCKRACTCSRNSPPVLRQHLLRLRIFQRPGRHLQDPYNGPCLPVHTTLAVSVGRATGERSKLAVNLASLLRHRALLDNSIPVGPSHFDAPGMFRAEFRSHFHF